MSEISKLLRDGMKRKGWSTVTEAAREIGVERTFLSRLLKGDPPRRKLGGSRGTVEPDERYQRMAEKLELGDEFLGVVARELEARAPKRRKAPAPKETESVDRQTLVDEYLRRRYPDLWRHVEARGELKGESALLELAEDCLTGIEAEETWKRRVTSYRWPEHFFEAKRHDRLGILPGLPRRDAPAESRVCRQIAEAITGETDAKTSESSRRVRIKIASFFFELSCRFD